jgi:hypothetical protein
METTGVVLLPNFRVIRPTPRAYTHTQVRQHADILRSMDEGTIKTQNPKCRLYWCLIDFDPSCELLPLLSDLPHPSPSSQSKRTVHTDGVWLWGGGGGGFRDWCLYSSFVHAPGYECSGKMFAVDQFAPM